MRRNDWVSGKFNKRIATRTEILHYCNSDEVAKKWAGTPCGLWGGPSGHNFQFAYDLSYVTCKSCLRTMGKHGK